MERELIAHLVRQPLEVLFGDTVGPRQQLFSCGLGAPEDLQSLGRAWARAGLGGW
jgi:hypothetical protein